jgi:hypothetical protein
MREKLHITDLDLERLKTLEVDARIDGEAGRFWVARYPDHYVLFPNHEKFKGQHAFMVNNVPALGANYATLPALIDAIEGRKTPGLPVCTPVPYVNDPELLRLITPRKLES